MLGLLNQWPEIVARFSTAKPWSDQVFTMFGSRFLGVLLMSIAPALVIGFVHARDAGGAGVTLTKVVLWGVSLGTFVAGLLALMRALGPSMAPLWPEVSSAGTYVPALAGLGRVEGYILSVSILMLIVVSMNHFTQQWTRRKIVFSILLVVVGLLLTGTEVETISGWLLGGTVVGAIMVLAYVLLLGRALPVLIFIVATMVALEQLTQAVYGGHPAAPLTAIVAIVGVLAMALFWYRRLQAAGPRSNES